MPGDIAYQRAFSRALAVAAKRDSEARAAEVTRIKALDRADRREWSHKRFGDEHRWQETYGGGRKYGTRRFIYDPAIGEVVEQ